MIKITVEIVPFGAVEDARTVWTIEIGNIKTVNDIADYGCYVVDSDDKRLAHFYVKNHPRSKGLARLLKRVFYKIDKVLDNGLNH
jgi:hypothetical protein